MPGAKKSHKVVPQRLVSTPENISVKIGGKMGGNLQKSPSGEAFASLFEPPRWPPRWRSSLALPRQVLGGGGRTERLVRYTSVKYCTSFIDSSVRLQNGIRGLFATPHVCLARCTFARLQQAGVSTLQSYC